MKKKWKSLIRGIITTIVAVIVMGTITFPVSAKQNLETSIQASAGIQSNQTFKNKKTERYINGAKYTSKAFPTPYSAYWYVIHHSDGVELLRSGTYYALDDSYRYGLRTYPRNKNQHQRWSVIRHSDGTISFRNNQTGKCIDDSFGHGLRTYPCNYSSYQKFY